MFPPRFAAGTPGPAPQPSNFPAAQRSSDDQFDSRAEPHLGYDPAAMDRARRKQLYNACKPEESLAPDDPRNVQLDAFGEPGTRPRGVIWAERLASAIELSDGPVFMLFTGLPGSGKTTELRRLMSLLEREHGPRTTCSSRDAGWPPRSSEHRVTGSWWFTSVMMTMGSRASVGSRSFAGSTKFATRSSATFVGTWCCCSRPDS